MYVCMYVCMYVFMNGIYYVRMYICMYVCMYVCMLCVYVLCTYICMSLWGGAPAKSAYKPFHSTNLKGPPGLTLEQ